MIRTVKKYYKNNNNLLKFEGEYLNGKRNGKGKDTLGNYRFEGEYLNGKKWKGKGYGPDGNIIYVLKKWKRICKRI